MLPCKIETFYTHTKCHSQFHVIIPIPIVISSPKAHRILMHTFSENWKPFNNMLSCFDTIHECDGHRPTGAYTHIKITKISYIITFERRSYTPLVTSTLSTCLLSYGSLKRKWNNLFYFTFISDVRAALSAYFIGYACHQLRVITVGLYTVRILSCCCHLPSYLLGLAILMVKDDFLTLPGWFTRDDINDIIFSICVSWTVCYMCPVCFLLVFLFLSALSAMSLSIVYFAYDFNIK